MSRHAQGSQPADFDLAACPIIATHWFGLPRKRACGLRVPDPGEMARAGELRKRGPRLGLVGAWRPTLTHLKTKGAEL